MRIMVRFPATNTNVKARLQQLVDAIAGDADFRASRVTLSTVIKMALLEGVEALERRYRVES